MRFIFPEYCKKRSNWNVFNGISKPQNFNVTVANSREKLVVTIFTAYFSALLSSANVSRTRRCTLFGNPHFFSDLNFRTKNYNFSMKIHFWANKVWIFAPNIIIRFDHFWCKNSIKIRFEVNFHAVISGFGATIKIGEKLRFFEHCAVLFPSSRANWGKKYRQQRKQLWQFFFYYICVGGYENVY